MNADHQQTMRVSTLRVPTWSPHQPVGISNSAYGQIERAEHVAHLRRREIEIARDVRAAPRRWRPDRDSDGRQRHRHGEHFPADAGVAGSRQALRWHRVTGRIGATPSGVNGRFCASMAGYEADGARHRAGISQRRRLASCRRAGWNAARARMTKTISRRPSAMLHARYVIVGGRPYSRSRFTMRCRRGGVIARFGVGHDGIDKTRATAAGLLCTNTPGVLDQSVAEHTMLLVAAAARRAHRGVGEHGEHAWNPATGRGTAGQDDSRSSGAAASGARSRASPRSATACSVVGCTRPDALGAAAPSSTSSA